MTGWALSLGGASIAQVKPTGSSKHNTRLRVKHKHRHALRRLQPPLTLPYFGCDCMMGAEYCMCYLINIINGINITGKLDLPVILIPLILYFVLLNLI